MYGASENCDAPKAALKDIGAFSFLELNKGIIQMQVTIKLTR